MDKKWFKENSWIVVVLLLVGGFLLHTHFKKDSSTLYVDELAAEEVVEVESEENVEESESRDEIIYVDLKGAVVKPGVYQMSYGSRVIDLLEEAGGFTQDAASDYINQAELLEDQAVIYVYTKDEITEKEISKDFNGDTFAANSSEDQNDGLVNINTASADELQLLPGIGPKKAEAIVLFREENGSFQTIDNLKDVSGIGEKTFERLKDLIKVK